MSGKAVVNGVETSKKPDEDCADLIFSPEFENAETLLPSEVYFLLQRRHNEEKSGDIDQSEISEIFKTTYRYTEKFNRYKSIEEISIVRNVLSKSYTQLHQFEVALLATLRPHSADEAKKLILSLKNKMDDDEIQEILDEIKPFLFQND
ncbi:DNA-directed RNA polymerase II subunit RPB4 [Thelohanellus kitauei]|uniref:DNA-directed RNA polymerase II subunit RPB4 n=1 Tax=Thelohanellus kitauei TaxID=669202 RepID=A0A0C2J4J3_THEKT|nr:DNA-directed RNA polymerase II subunit RPB4 [Thelohanellus kitauei]